MSEGMTDERLKELEKFVEHDRIHIGGNAVEADELEEACKEIRRLRENLKDLHEDLNNKIEACADLEEENAKLRKEAEGLRRAVNAIRKWWKESADTVARIQFKTRGLDDTLRELDEGEK